MKSGTNYLTVLATDISGSAVNGLESSWSIEGQVNGLIVSTVAVSGAIGGDGYYIGTVTLPAGQGYVSIRNSTPGVYIAPDFFDLDIDSYDTDDIYGKFTATGIQNLPAGSPSRFSVVSLSVKQDSDIVETIQIPSKYLPLTGYTNMSVQCFPATRLNDSTIPPISGAYSATVLSETEGTVEIHIGDDVIGNVIAQGSSSATIYGDIKYFDADGNERRPVELQISIRRDFNNNN